MERWFVAELVLKITVENDRRLVAHKNRVLVQAKSGEQAYAKALELGRQDEISYQNPSGKTVHIRFVGVSELSCINDRLEDGAELWYEEHVDVTDEVIQDWITPKANLTIFRQITPSSGPDYRSGEVLEKAVANVRSRREQDQQ